MNPDQIATRTGVAMREHANYSHFVQRCARIMHQAHDLGWKVTSLLNDARTIRRAESLFGFDLRHDFPEQTTLSKLIYGP